MAETKARLFEFRPLMFEKLRSFARFIPDGFRDEDGVWHEGPHRVEFEATLELLESDVNKAVNRG